MPPARLAALPRRRARTAGGGELELYVANSTRARFAGLAGLAELAPGAGLVIPRCPSIHTVGMRFEIDVAFVHWPRRQGGRSTVLGTREGIPPLRLARVGSDRRGVRRREVGALELTAGEVRRLGLQAGEELTLENPPPARS